MMTMVLSNPRVAGVITMIAIAVLSTGLSYLIFFLFRNRALNKKVRKIAKHAIEARDETIAGLRETLADRDAELARKNARLTEVALFLGKAVTAAGMK